MRLGMGTNGLYINVGSGIAGDPCNKTFRVVVEYVKVATSDPSIPEGPSMINLSDVPNPLEAKMDYISMMSGIEVPVDSSAAQSSPQSTDGPDFEGSNDHSKHYEDIQKYYKYACWNQQMVHDAVGRWITTEEYEQIAESERGAHT